MKRKEKNIEEYRRDIFILKSKIKEEEQYLEELEQKYSEVNVFAEQSYTYQMKMKILQNNLSEVKHKIEKYSAQDEANKDYYELNFCTYALMRACDVVGISEEMVFRAVDTDNKGIVNYLDLANFLREVLRLSSSLANPIMAVLDPEQTTEVKWARYHKYIQSFMLESEKPQKQGSISHLTLGVENLARQLVDQNVPPNQIWGRVELLNIATAIGGLMRALKDIDVLDCVAAYCRCDPNKEGVIKSETIVALLEQRVNDLKHFASGKTFKIKKN